MDVKLQIDNLVTKLTNYHWSPEHPSTYTVMSGGVPRGVGKIAEKNYGAFNLAWGACNGKWQSKDDQYALVVSFARFQVLTMLTVDNEPIGDWACLLGPKGFRALITAANNLEDKHKIELVDAATGAMHVQHV